ncbi:MAG TPA: hypothetical protein VI259_01075, partial [Gemmatimonadaceae bacterium]
MSTHRRFVQSAAAVSVALIAIACDYVWQTRSVPTLPGPRFGRVTTNAAIAADSSRPLSTLSPPDDNSDAATVEREEARANTPLRMALSRASAGVEQLAPGTKPAARLAASFDGLGVGFEGPNGTGRGGNPSDNALAVGPNHIVQIVNGRGIAVFTKKGRKYDTTGKVLFGPVPANNVFKNFTGNCEARNSGDVVVR